MTAREEWTRQASVLPQEIVEQWLGEPPVGWQHRSGLTALLSRDEIAPGDLRWHLSVRHGDPGHDGRPPSWDELVKAAHDLRPGVVFVLPLPPRSWWINVHPHVLHLHEVRDPALVESWRAERRGDQPT